jgi:hypothetical protein
MEKESKTKLDNIIKELSNFLEKDFSSQFRYLSAKEDRQLFFLAKTLTQLKQISNENKNESKIEDKKVEAKLPRLYLQRIK